MTFMYRETSPKDKDKGNIDLFITIAIVILFFAANQISNLIEGQFRAVIMILLFVAMVISCYFIYKKRIVFYSYSIGQKENSDEEFLRIERCVGSSTEIVCDINIAKIDMYSEISNADIISKELYKIIKASVYSKKRCKQILFTENEKKYAVLFTPSENLQKIIEEKLKTIE